MNAQRQPLDLQNHCEVADRILELVKTRLPDAEPQVRDWNDRLLVMALGRAYRCLRSVRELAGRAEGDDAEVLTRALVALTLRYLWLAAPEDEGERRVRLRQFLRKWWNDRAVLGAELIDLGFVPGDEASADSFQGRVDSFREQADALRDENFVPMPGDRDTAIALDRYLRPPQPRFFELIYARIYRTTSDVAHYAVGVALSDYPRDPDDPGGVDLARASDQQAAVALGLGLVTFVALLGFSEAIVRHGLAGEAAATLGELREA